MKLLVPLAAASLATASCDRAEEPPVTPTTGYIVAAVQDAGRETQKRDDAKRHPAEIMAFTGVKPGDKVFELIPGEGYWTRLFSKIVGPEGRVYAVWPQQYARYSQHKVAMLRTMAADPAYPNITVDIQSTPAVTTPEQVDLVFTSQNYHDYPAEFMGNLEPAVLNKAAWDMLKPGGTYMVIDHAALPGTTLEATRELHRIDPALVRHQAEAAGFQFSGSLDVLRNPQDQHAIKVFDPKVRGNTDKFALKFRKPTD